MSAVAHALFGDNAAAAAAIEQLDHRQQERLAETSERVARIARRQLRARANRQP